MDGYVSCFLLTDGESQVIKGPNSPSTWGGFTSMYRKGLVDDKTPTGHSSSEEYGTVRRLGSLLGQWVRHAPAHSRKNRSRHQKPSEYHTLRLLLALRRLNTAREVEFEQCTLPGTNMEMENGPERKTIFHYKLVVFHFHVSPGRACQQAERGRRCKALPA